MAIQIQAPDGSIAEFPNGTSDATITSVMAKTFGGPSGGAKAQAPAAKPSALKDSGKSFVQGLREGVASISDAVLQASPVGMVRNALATAGALSQGDARVTPAPFAAATHATQAHGYQPQTTQGQYARSVGAMVPNAFAPGMGGVVRRVASAVLPGVASEAAGQGVQAMGGNALAQGAARLVGGVAGGVAAGARVNALAATPADDAAANILARRGKPDVAQMRAKADEMNAAGVPPTLLDIAGNRGRRLVRAVGVKSDMAGETLQNNAQAVSSTTKPAVMARTRGLGPNPGQTADDLAAALKKARDDAAQMNYAKPYDTFVEIPDKVKDMLADSAGRSIIARARADAIENQDWGRQVELDKLLQPADPGGVGPLPQVSAGTIDRLIIAARERGAKFAERGNNLRAKGAYARRDQLDATLSDVPELQPARADYRAKSQAIDVLGKGRKDLFSTDPADYGKWLQSLSPEAQSANKVAIRQEILDTLGGQRSSTFGSIDELASSDYAKQNLRQALGAEADPYLAHLNARLEQARNASFVSPNAGSRTAVLENDLKGVANAAKTAVRAVKGGVVGAAAAGAEWLMSRGVSEPQARALAKAAVDPAQTERVLRQLEGRFGRGSARQFVQHISRPALTAGALGALQAGTASPPSQSP